MALAAIMAVKSAGLSGTALSATSALLSPTVHEPDGENVPELPVALARPRAIPAMLDSAAGLSKGVLSCTSPSPSPSSAFGSYTAVVALASDLMFGPSALTSMRLDSCLLSTLDA